MTTGVVLRLIWQSKARSDLRRILAYIADRNPPAADQMLALIDRATEHLPQHPFLYRPGRVTDTREAVVHPNYIVIYRVTDEAVNILAVVHARQQYP